VASAVVDNPPGAVIDLRPRAAFERLHPAGAWNLAPEEIARWPFALPPRDRPIFLLADDPARAAAAASILRRGGRGDIRLLSADPDAWPVTPERGPERPALWPAPWLAEAAPLLPASGTALDVAAGSGRNAVWLALRGLEVTAVDRLPDALERARRLAARLGVRLATIQADLRRPEAWPRGPFDVVAVFRFLDRRLFPTVRAAVSSGGLVLFETFVGEASGPGAPPRPGRRLLPGELAQAFGGFEVLRLREARPEAPGLASIVARRPAE
jgi:tellurite methyltransferase